MGRRRDADDAHGGRGSEASVSAPPAAAGEEGLIREFSTLRRELEAVSKALVRTPEDERRLARKGVITERLRVLSVEMSSVGMKGHHDARSPASDVDAVVGRASSNSDDENRCADLPRRPRVARAATTRAYESSDMDESDDDGGGGRSDGASSSASLSDGREGKGQRGGKKGKSEDAGKATKAHSTASSRGDAEADGKPASGGGVLRGFFGKRGGEAAAPTTPASVASDKTQTKRKNSVRLSESKDEEADAAPPGKSTKATDKKGKKKASDLALLSAEQMQAESLALTKEVAKLRRKGSDRTDAEDARMAEARDRLEALADRILDGDGVGSADSSAASRKLASSSSAASSHVGSRRARQPASNRPSKAGVGKAGGAQTGRKPSKATLESDDSDAGSGSAGDDAEDDFGLDVDNGSDDEDEMALPPKTRLMGLPLSSRKNVEKEDAAPPPTFRFLARLKRGAAEAAAEARTSTTKVVPSGDTSADEDDSGAPPKSIFGRMIRKKKPTTGSSRKSVSSKAADETDEEDFASLAGDDDKSSRSGAKKGVKAARKKVAAGAAKLSASNSAQASPALSSSSRSRGGAPSKSPSNTSLKGERARKGKKGAAADESAKVKASAVRVGDAVGNAKERMARRGEKLAAMDNATSAMKDDSTSMAAAARALRAKQEKSDKWGGFF